MLLLRSYAALLSALGLLATISSALQPVPGLQSVSGSQPASAVVTTSDGPAPLSPGVISRLSSCPGLLAAPAALTSKSPLLIAVGASFTAGVGAGQTNEAWPYDLGHLLGWRVVTEGVSGAGYVNPGRLGLGPLSHQVAGLNLPRLEPSLIILQAGHNDIGASLPLVSQRVASLLATIHRQAPKARVALLTVFSRRLDGLPAPIGVTARLTDSAIVTAARQADPDVTVVDPLAGRWRFPTLRDHLHPTPAGHLLIARDVARHLCGAAHRPPALRPGAVRHRPNTTGSPARA